MNPNDPAPKKGLSGLAIAGIGCGALLVLIIAVFAFIGVKAMDKMKEVAGADWQKNPMKALAMVAAKANPDWDVVKEDDAKGELTVKLKKTGEEITMSYNEVSQGKFKMKNSTGEETALGPNTAPPAWVPAYPGAAAQGYGMRTEKPTGVVGVFIVQTSDAPEKVREFFETKLKADGYTITASPNATGTTDVSAKKEAEKRSITVEIRGDKEATHLSVIYEGPK